MTLKSSQSVDLSNHPLTHWTQVQNGLGEDGLALPDFNRIKDEDFEQVLPAAFAAHLAQVNAISEQSEAPTIENTLKKMELAGAWLDRAASLFGVYTGTLTNETLQAAEMKLSAAFSRHFAQISMNEKLFERFDTLYQRRDELALDSSTLRVLELYWKNFVRAGAKLDAAGKKRLAQIDEQLASIGAKFGQNVLADEANWYLLLEEKDLNGIPDFLKQSMAQAAKSRDFDGQYCVTLSRSIYEPFMTFSKRRDLREKVLHAFTHRGQNGGDHDNSAIITQTLTLRNEKAKLLGFENFAAFKLDKTMAKTPQNVMNLLTPVWQKAIECSGRDQVELMQIARQDGINDEIEAWDWRYYAEQLRAEKFAFDEAQIKPYLQLDNIISACFDCATRLFGITFEELNDVSAWNDDTRVFRVKNDDGSIRGLFLADYFARPSKRSGAWMSSLRGGHGLDGGEKPIIYNVMNFAKPAKGNAALLSMDEARTLFHEFGHALHGLLTQAHWPSIAGTSVSRDFVELPSQLYEHWLTVPETLQKHARHYQSGEPMPKELIDKLLAAQKFDQGFATVEFCASALMDMAFHNCDDKIDDPMAFEAETMAQLQKPRAIPMRHRTPHFLHVFSGDGYSAGYYSYLWSEVLDADAFKAFEEVGDPYNQEIAQKLRQHIYSAGGSKDPEELYLNFRGRMPSPDAMMEGRGLV